MKVILTTDVPKVGNRYDVKDFKEGYAQNVLISRGLAVLATPSELAKLADRKDKIERQKEEENKIFDSLVSSINNTKVEIKVKANDKGHLFKSINPRDVVKAVRDTLGIEIDEHAFVMDHVKKLGVHTIKIKKGEIDGSFEIEIIKN